MSRGQIEWLIATVLLLIANGVPARGESRFAAELAGFLFRYHEDPPHMDAIKAGVFKDEIVPLALKQSKGPDKIFDTDEHPRFGTTVEMFAKLSPAFMGLGPINACKQLILKSRLSVKDLDLIEINEAFASQSIQVHREMG